jgi:transketolase
MRKIFASLLLEKMKHDKDVVLCIGDVGYGLFDQIRKEVPSQFYNFGSSEMALLGAAVGMTLEGKTVYVYSITPFVIYRPFEIIRNYIDHEKIPVKLVGSGRNRDYGYLGFSHWSEDDTTFMPRFKSVKSYWPHTQGDLKDAFKYSLTKQTATYINLRR